jgi:hypothetical protein
LIPEQMICKDNLEISSFEEKDTLSKCLSYLMNNIILFDDSNGSNRKEN